MPLSSNHIDILVGVSQSPELARVCVVCVCHESSALDVHNDIMYSYIYKISMLEE